ncbi:hypothetical protein CDV36_007428 [Fusarium kuroshium]|uniref:Uncharacterized protein n=1 Tax=Fusarium kuroshium TaxID=2010991 RepID=A0A3M2S5U4_9HYPO|nr:hypothetical protein CDV36_007428 [Fusarium kuroshium]
MQEAPFEQYPSALHIELQAHVAHPLFRAKAIIIYRSHEAGDYQLQESQTMPAS